MKTTAKKVLKKIKYLPAAISVWFVTAQPVLAQNIEVWDEFKDVGETGYGIKSGELDQSLGEVIGGYLNAAFGLLGVILVVLVIYAGFLWMTASGNADQVKKAKGILINAVIGIIIIMAAYAITDFVLKAVIGE